MPETKPELTQLAARKQLLLLESDLNRALLVEVLDEWKKEYLCSKQQLMRISSIASTVTQLITTVSTVRRLFSRGSNNGKKSWLSLLFDGVTTGTSVWNFLRSRRHEHED